ncbi:hypothetical protein B0I35DRAFT_3876 [Stachybotrys elegans]|uniref:Uncharacterized protein n=1 Tax=Stachybotrys elegans TaxID=80388 RepID=A0A8K0WW90_9HYPO|nr:hypothetical protein B0I35DRAFT_3876 [Stachybotrys elegans]
MSQHSGRRKRSSKWKGGSSWTGFSVRSYFKADASLRRPQISAPSDFRHVSSASFQFPPQEEHRQLRQPPAARPSSFRPLELSIHMPENHVSPILPHFDYSRRLATPPPAYIPRHSDDDHQLVHETSYSSFPTFHIPRRPTVDSSPSSVESTPPRIPPKSPGRARAHTSPDMDRIKERVANAMIEMEKLQKQIDDVIERQSLYTASRPSTAHSMARTLPDLEPMPSIPALPPAAPSFAERLYLDVERPQTAPIRSPIPSPSHTERGASAAKRPPPTRRDNGPLPPPLPLVLRPPLRKKKSFSRVSNWLTGGEHSRDMSLDSVTNLPRPVRNGDGFYQCVPAGGRSYAISSFESLQSVSSWETSDNMATAPTAWSLSPQSTPRSRKGEPLLERTATFGSKDGRGTVGVAF